MVPDAALIDRFARDLDALIPSGARVGVAVSGGADSLALLLLAAAARPAAIEAATVDHGFRAESRGEAETVAAVCSKLGIPHAILDVRWREKPKTAIQERARQERYRLLGFWAEERGLRAVATGHHADDQAETFLMRLNRGAGVRGLAGMRPRSIAPGTDIRLIRPLLRWRHSELEDVCAAAHLTPAVDSSNDDAQFERVRLRQSLAAADWLDPAAIARSASHLADAEIALDWAVRQCWKLAVQDRDGSIAFAADDIPAEIHRRVVARAIRRLATEGEDELRGPELDRLVATLSSGGIATLRGVACSGGATWRFTVAPARRL